MADLVPAHGGLAEPVSCTVTGAEQAAFLAEPRSCPRCPSPTPTCRPSTASATARSARSPARWTSATYNRVLDESVIEHNGKHYAWTIPLALPVTAELAGDAQAGHRRSRS